MAVDTNGTRRVAVLDSGVGGLSVCREIVRHVPAVDLFYVADNAAFPYGTRPADELRARVVQLAQHIVAREQPQLLVIACNTASTIALNAVRAAVPVPVVGVVPAIKTAAAQSRTRAIGLLGTPATVRSTYTETLIRRFAADCRVVRVGSAELAPWAEGKMTGQPPDRAAITRVIAPFFDPPAPPVDTVVLACTHFPWLRPELRRAAAHRVAWIDSGRAIARRVATLLPQAAENRALWRMTLRYAFTREAPAAQRLISRLQRFGARQVIIDWLPQPRPSTTPEGAVDADD